MTREDAGKYSCIAHNELGEASAPAWLIIEGETAVFLTYLVVLGFSDVHYFSS